jgi:hypothetical protein
MQPVKRQGMFQPVNHQGMAQLVNHQGMVKLVNHQGMAQPVKPPRVQDMVQLVNHHRVGCVWTLAMFGNRHFSCLKLFVSEFQPVNQRCGHTAGVQVGVAQRK